MEIQVVHDEGTPVATVIGVRPPWPDVDPGKPLVLSRFSWLRREGTALVVESARGTGHVELTDSRTVALLAKLVAPVPPNDDLAGETGLSGPATEDLVSALVAIGALVPAADPDYEHELPLAVWEFHDLLFHARSRRGRHLNPMGGTYRFAGRIEPAPALPAPRSSTTIELVRPDFDRLAREDPPLSAVQAARRSIRDYAPQPLDLGELAEFLFRVARVEDLIQYPGRDPAHPEEFAVRPYPAGGSLYELECYVGVARCEGLAPGLYHYAAGGHHLELLCGASEKLDELLAIEGGGAMIAGDRMQVLVLLTARMHRIAWKYAGLAYSLVLKHVGVLYDQMYLAATAMGLAPCAIGGGDSDLFARVSGIDYYDEPLVGEFALGRPAPER